MGPKPTKLQLETLTKLAAPGVTVHEWSETRGPLHAYISYPSGDPKKSNKTETLRHDVMCKFSNWGWLKEIGDPEMRWRNMEYAITDEGREVIAKGEIRK